MTTLQKSRPSATGTVDQVSSLNSTRSHMSIESKSSAFELLSITDAAVSALGNAKKRTHNPHSSHEQSYSMLHDGINLLSPMEIGPSPTELLHSPLSDSCHELSGRSSNGSHSTTASEVLIRSTVQNPDGPSCPNTSNLSKISDTSQASSTFLTGQAKPVKVLSKKLKQIKSPFDDRQEDVNNVNSFKQYSGKPHPRSSKSGTNTGNKHNNLKSLDSITQEKKRLKSQPPEVKIAGKTSDCEQHTIPHSDTCVNKDGISLKQTEERTFPRSDPHAADDDAGNYKEHLPSAMTESGYMTQSVKAIKDYEMPIEDTIDEQSTPRGPLSLTEDLFSGTNDQSPIDVIAQDQEPYSRDTSTSSGQPEIFTVPETIVTVRATDVNRQDRSESLSSISSGEPTYNSTALENRFSKFHTSGLRQGRLIDVSQNTNSEASNSDQVHIAKMSMTDKQKQLRSAFANRNTGTHAVKKHVTPTVVQPEVTSSVDPRRPNQQTVNDAATTAAVAAASAVAATQPFLKAQQDLEHRIAQLMEKVGSVHSQPPQAAEPRNNKVEVLERQLNDLTQHRLQYLEDMQKQQLQWQAQLLSISRVPGAGKEVPPPGEYNKHYSHPNKAITKTVMSDDELGLQQYMPRTQTRDKEKSVLDTPAPRAKPPTPTILDDTQKSEVRGHIAGQVTPDRRNKGPGGLLAHILSQDGDTPQRSAFPDTSYGIRPQEVGQKADELVQELGDLKTQMKQAIADANQWKEGAADENVSRAPQPITPVLDRTMSMYDGQAPIDHYMNKVIPPPTSPYPKLKELSAQANAPVISHFSEAQDVLKKVTLSRTYLEANLDSIMRNRQETDIYSLLENIARDSSQTDRLRVQKMVDKHINAMNSNMEREVLDELLKVEEAKKNITNFMIPERDTTGVTDKSKVKATAPRGRFRAEARVDTGLSKKRDGIKNVEMKTGEKENVPQKKFKKFKVPGSKPMESEELKSRIYGKAAHIPQRKTQKEPYLRFRSTSPNPSSPKNVGRPVEAKGILVSAAKSQAGDGYIPPLPAVPQHQMYTPPTKQNWGLPPPPALIPMAIPLGAPRKDGGLTSAISFPSHPSGPFTSTPQIAALPPNVGILTMKDRELEEEEKYKREMAAKKKEVKLEKRTLPSVDIDSFQTPPVSPRLKVMTPKDEQPRKNVEFHKITEKESPQVMETSESEEEDDTMTEDADSAAIDIPGFTVPPASAYHGPQFPPQAPPIAQAPPTSDVLANDIRRRDLLQNQALDWVEQELMARVISEVYAKRQDAVPHTPVSTRPTRQHTDDEEQSESEISQVSSHESFIAETLGHDGFQLFVDAGQPVDDKLVNALLKEVILEKISSVVGQRTSQDDDDMRHTSMARQPKPGPSQSVTKQPVHRIESPVQIPDTPVVTPQVTPRHTPPRVTSPAEQVTPPVTPDRTPSPSIADQPEPIVPLVTSEHEDSTRDDSEEARFKRIIDGHPISLQTRVGESPGPPHYEVSTPDNTPPPSPPPGVGLVRTPSPSLRTPSPVEVSPSPQSSPEHREPEAISPVSPIIEQQPIEEPEKPLMFSVAVQAEAEDPVSHSPPPPAPKLQPRRLSASSEDSPASASSTISDTVNERLSEGQWLLSLHSEGEVPKLQADQVFHERIRQLLVGSKPVRGHGVDDSHADDTLLDTDELDPDQSEGEFLHNDAVFNDRAAALALVAQMKPSAPGWAHQRPIQPSELATGVDHSLGEVSFGQRPRLTSAQERSVFGQSVGRRAANGNNGRLGRHLSEEHESLGEISEGPEHVVQSPGVKTISVQPRSSPIEGSPVRGAMRPVTVMAGGREPSRHQKTSFGKGAHPRVIQVGRSLSPDPVEESTRSPPKPIDTGASQTSLFGASDLETQTTDQMNMEAILQSHDYLANTQSDLGSTAPDLDVGQTDKFFSSLNRSEEFYRQSGLMRQSIGSTSDMSLAPGLTKTLERSEEELAQDSRQSYSADSDLRTSGLLATGTRTIPASRTGPLQVSVTIPSVGEEDSQESYEDVSEFSFV